jgi:nuclear transport factor 2 (NTF2) superfamily protein
MEKKELVKGFKTIVEDLLDNYDKYTDEEKAKVKEIFLKASELNRILDKYDVEYKIDWDQYFTSAGRYFDAYH